MSFPGAAKVDSTASVEAVTAAGGGETAVVIARVEARMGALASGYVQTLARHAPDTISAGGKRLRPLLVMLAADALNGPPDTPEGDLGLLRGAVAVSCSAVGAG